MFFTRSIEVLSAFRAIAWNLVAICLILISLYALYKETFPFRPKVEFRPIHVSPSLDTTIFTPLIVKQHLIDGISRIPVVSDTLACSGL